MSIEKKVKILLGREVDEIFNYIDHCITYNQNGKFHITHVSNPNVSNHVKKELFKYIHNAKKVKSKRGGMNGLIPAIQIPIGNSTSNGMNQFSVNNVFERSNSDYPQISQVPNHSSVTSIIPSPNMQETVAFSPFLDKLSNTTNTYDFLNSDVAKNAFKYLETFYPENFERAQTFGKIFSGTLKVMPLLSDKFVTSYTPALIITLFLGLYISLFERKQGLLEIIGSTGGLSKEQEHDAKLVDIVKGAIQQNMSLNDLVEKVQEENKLFSEHAIEHVEQVTAPEAVKEESKVEIEQIPETQISVTPTNETTETTVQTDNGTMKIDIQHEKPLGEPAPSINFTPSLQTKTNPENMLFAKKYSTQKRSLRRSSRRKRSTRTVKCSLVKRNSLSIKRSWVCKPRKSKKSKKSKKRH
jgi:hypothetical protein